MAGKETMAGHRLQEVPLFAGLSPEVIEELAAGSRVRRYPAGQVIWSEGDPGDALLILEEGQLRIFRMGLDGQESVLAVIEPPATIGELALLDGEPRSATVVAQRAVTVRFVPRQTFRQLLAREPSMVYELLKTLARMVRASDERYSRVLGLDVPGRLAAWLLDRAARSEQTAGGPVTVMMRRSQGELAAELGTTRSTVNRALKDFEDRGLIAIEGEQVTLLHRAKLEQLTC
jgi:CRP-like cAMP-binding protein